LLDVDSSQCERDSDCVGLLGRDYVCGSSGICKRDESKPGASGGADAGAGIAKRWACLDKVSKPPAEGPDTVEVGFDVLDFTTLKPPEGLVVQVCSATDVSCTDPVLQDVLPDADGNLTFDLPFAFKGYFELNAPGFTPALSYNNVPAYTDGTYAGPLLVSPQAIQDLAGLGGESVDPNLGTVVLEVVDCDGHAGDGVKLAKKEAEDERPFYFEGGLPDRELDMTAVTSALGRNGTERAVGGFSNVKPGFVTFEATLVEPKRTVATFAVQVRAGYMTYVRLQAGY
jgi:hypothetical protein